MFYDPCFRGPPQKHPPQISPPVCKIWRFLGPPPDPPFFEVLAPDPLGHDPWPPSFMMFFYLMVWSSWDWSSIIIIFNDVMFIKYFYKHDRLLAMHQGAPSYIRLYDSSSRVLLQKNTLPLPITMAKSAFFTLHTAQERVLPLYIGHFTLFIG